MTIPLSFKHVVTFILAAILLILLAATRVVGAVIFVSASASPGGDGSAGHPYATIQEAMTHASRGDTVQVLPGYYSGMVTIPADVVLRGSGALTTTIVAADQENVVRCGSGSTLAGFTLEVTGRLMQQGAVSCADASPVIQDNVLIKTITNGDFPAVHATGGNPVIRRNYIVGFTVGIWLYAHTPVTMDAAVRNNVIVSPLAGIIEVDAADGEFENNTIVITEFGQGISAITASNGSIRNNLVIGPSEDMGYGLFPSDYSVAWHVAYNDVWHFRTNYSGISQGVGGMSVDPLFVDADGADYRLTTGSPARHAGDPAPAYNNVDASRNDMGAFGGPDPIDGSIFPGFAVTVGIGNASGYAGDTVEVPLFIRNGNRVADLVCTLTFDDALLSFVSLEKTDLTSGMAVTAEWHEGKSCNLAIFGRPIGGSGDILQLRFRVSPAAPDYAATPLSLSHVNAADTDQVPLILQEVRSGAVGITPSYAGAGYLFVDRRNSSGIEDGTRMHPWKTIQAAAAHAHAGDTVFIGAGDYRESVDLGFTENIALRGSGAGITTFGNNTSPEECGNAFCRLWDTHGASLSDMTLVAVATPLCPAVSMILGSHSSVEIHDCNILMTEGMIIGTFVAMGEGSTLRFHDNRATMLMEGAGPVILMTDSSRSDVYRNVFRVIGRAVDIRGGMIRNNIFLGSLMYDGLVGAGGEDSIVISNNLFSDPGGWQAGVWLGGTGLITVANNTFATGTYGIFGDFGSCDAYNNIVTENRFAGIRLPGGVSSSYNDAWNNAANFLDTPMGPGDISANPLFVDQAQNDFRLLAGSPCRDAGNPDPKYNDLDGTRNDMGVFGGPGLDTTFFRTTGATLRIMGVASSASETLAVPLTARAVLGLASAELVISFDTAEVKLTSVTTTSHTAGFSLGQSSPAPGMVAVALSSNHPLREDSVELAYLHFVPVMKSGKADIKFRSGALSTATSAGIPVKELVDGQISLTAVTDRPSLPVAYALRQNYPNPFNPATAVRYELPRVSQVTFTVYDVLGRTIRVFEKGSQPAGSYELRWNGRDDRGRQAASGVYFGTLRAGSFGSTIKMLIVR